MYFSPNILYTRQHLEEALQLSGEEDFTLLLLLAQIASFWVQTIHRELLNTLYWVVAVAVQDMVAEEVQEVL
jgi:hypothetical protein